MEKIILVVLAISIMAVYYNPGMHQKESSHSITFQHKYKTFLNWSQKYSKLYGSLIEREHRFQVYLKNLITIRQHQESGSEVELGENQFMDLEYDEFRSLMMKGRKKSSNHGLTQQREKIVYLNITDLPNEVDWRGKAVPPIKNQGSCGACWAFSTVGALEGAWGVKNTLVSFSEQQLIDCCRIDLYGCNGGDPIVALDECISRDGIMLSSDYPYADKTSKDCLWDSANIVFTPTDYAIVPHNDSIQLQMAVSKQPVSVCISDAPVFHFYKKGIVLDSPECGLDNDHCIVAVGYGTQEGKDYWLLRNSWGASWGNDGYIMVKRDKEIGPGMCGIAMESTYVII